MKDAQEAGQAETAAKSPDSNNLTSFQIAFKAALDQWKKDGCPVQIEDPQRAGEKMACGAPPHRTKLLPAVDGIVTMEINCANDHEAVWKHEVAEADLKAELARQVEAAALAEKNGGKAKDPLKASVTITLDLRTQDVQIDPWVPTPGVGLQLAAMLTAHFSEQLMTSKKKPAQPFVLPGAPRGIVHPKTGKLLTQ